MSGVAFVMISPGGGMRRPHVEHHLFANVVLGMAQLRIGRDDSRHWIGRFNLARREGHGLTILSTLASQSATANVKWGAHASRLNVAWSRPRVTGTMTLPGRNYRWPDCLRDASAQRLRHATSLQIGVPPGTSALA